jgi:hypothetical protein
MRLLSQNCFAGSIYPKGLIGNDPVSNSTLSVCPRPDFTRVRIVLSGAILTNVTAKPIVVKGKYNEALVYAKALEYPCENKIRQYLDHPAFADTTVRIMPDVHLGKSTVIGWTATYRELIIPSIIGLDIGCGRHTGCRIH